MSETTTPTLSDFLLARLAYDARVYGGHQHGLPSQLAARLLAQCKANRRIAIAASEWAALCPPDDWPEERGVDSVIASDVGRWLLRTLALPYADHPDYREEWKP